MIDFEKAAVNALEENFISVITGCFFTSRKISLDAFKNKDWLHDITRIMISLLVLGCLLVWLLFQKSTLLIVSLF